MIDDKLSFKIVTEEIVRKEIMDLDDSQSTFSSDIFVNILKLTVDIHLLYVINIMYFSIEKGHFPDELKFTEVGPISKKKDELDKDNFSSASVLTHLSKVLKRIIYH